MKIRRGEPWARPERGSDVRWAERGPPGGTRSEGRGPRAAPHRSEQEASAIAHARSPGGPQDPHGS